MLGKTGESEEGKDGERGRIVGRRIAAVKGIVVKGERKLVLGK